MPFNTKTVSSKIRRATNPIEFTGLKAGVAQYQIAEDLSCDIRTIQRYEAGEQFPDWNELLKMKVRYSCEFADLFPEEFR